jgi:hypothetical protein
MIVGIKIISLSLRISPMRKILGYIVFLAKVLHHSLHTKRNPTSLSAKNGSFIPRADTLARI